MIVTDGLGPISSAGSSKAVIDSLRAEVLLQWHGVDMTLADAVEAWLISRGGNVVYQRNEGDGAKVGQIVNEPQWQGWSLVYRGYVTWVNIGCTSTRELLYVCHGAIFCSIANIDEMIDGATSESSVL